MKKKWKRIKNSILSTILKPCHYTTINDQFSCFTCQKLVSSK